MGNLRVGVMPCGLWRYKVQQWLPRPVYHYYAALMDAFRPGVRLHSVQGCPSGLRALAGVAGKRRTLVLVNTAQSTVTVRIPWQDSAVRLRIAPDCLPAASDLPLSAYAPQAVVGGATTIDLEPMELSVVQ